MLFSHGHNRAFLLPDLCTTTERNGNRISIDKMPMKAIRTMLVSAIFRQCGSCIGLLDIAG